MLTPCKLDLKHITVATLDDEFFDGSHFNKEIISFLNKMNYELNLRINT
jgi:hypothetical protein